VVLSRTESRSAALRRENESNVWCRWAPISWLAVVGGCTSYHADPLHPTDVVGKVAETRLAPMGDAAPDSSEPFTLARAAAWMRVHGPRVRDAIAAYQTSLAVANISTPLPNPSLELGPEFGFGSGVNTNELTAFGAVGFAIPTGGRLHYQDELNGALAELARVRAITEIRNLYLSLRQRFAGLAIARSRESLLVEITRSASESLTTTQSLVVAGQATAIDVALFQLEHSQTLLSSITARMATTRVESELARQVGVSRRLFQKLPEDPLPKIPGELPTLHSLQALLVGHRSALLNIRSEYIAAERSLRLQISKQYPDFRFGPSLGGETGERKSILGLTLGIDVPLFNQNQQAIARATKQREAVRTRYETEASRALADLDAAFETVSLSRERRKILLDTILPRAEANIALARKTLVAGSGSTLRLLDAERSFRNIQINALDAQLAELSAWADLEQAVGYPLLSFPLEDAAEALRPPEALRKTEHSKATRQDEGSE
jgi:outer membrane protein, heavy metal efflux system